MPCTVLHGTGHSYFYQMDYIVQISHIQTGIGVLHIAAQLKQHLIQRVGGQIRPQLNQRHKVVAVDADVPFIS